MCALVQEIFEHILCVTGSYKLCSDIIETVSAYNNQDVSQIIMTTLNV